MICCELYRVVAGCSDLYYRNTQKEPQYLYHIVDGKPEVPPMLKISVGASRQFWNSPAEKSASNPMDLDEAAGELTHPREGALGFHGKAKPGVTTHQDGS
jgi:hypothetical protein